MTKKIKDKSKETIEHIKLDAKNYYKGKNMIFRYIIIGFLFILLILQFLLPDNNSNPSVETNDTKIDSNISQKEDQYISGLYVFLDKDISREFNNIQKDLDTQVLSIINNLPALNILYKKSLSFLPDLQDKLKKNDIPLDFQYIVLLNGLDNIIWILPDEVIKKYKLRVDDDIDERLNIEKSTDAMLLYLNDLYEQFGEWELALLGYLIGGQQLEDIMDDQKQTSFKDLYLESYILDQYYRVMGYKYVIENIGYYIDTSNIKPYFESNTSLINIGETKDLFKFSKSNGYTFKEIKELNPWILGNSLPKGQREIKVYSK